MERCPPLKEALWYVIDTWDDALKRRLLKFVTGVDMLPTPGTETIRIEIPFMSFSAADHARALRTLPQSHVREEREREARAASQICSGTHLWPSDARKAGRSLAHTPWG
jgi:hypothetical protein